jgi:hypothetical protein
MGILIFKGLTALRLYKSFGIKGLMPIICEFLLFLAADFNEVHTGNMAPN